MGARVSKPQDSKEKVEITFSPIMTIKEANEKYRKLYYNNYKNNEYLLELNQKFDAFKKNLDLDVYYSMYTQIFKEDDDFKKQKEVKTERKRCETRGNGFETPKKADQEAFVIPEEKKVAVRYEEGEYKVSYQGYETVFNFSRTSEDFFMKVCTAYTIITTIAFSDPDFVKFYRFWNNLIIDDRTIKYKVSKIVQLIKKNDPREKNAKEEKMCFDTPKQINKVVKEKKQEKKWKIYCESCKKGFNNENTLNDHLKSKQHKSNCNGCQCIKKEDAETIEDILIEKEFMGNGLIEDESIKTDLEDNKPTKIKNKEVKDLKIETTANDQRKRSNEHVIFRTCGICKLVLETREDILIHLRNEHGD